MANLAELKVHTLAQTVSDDTWRVVRSWPFFDQDTLGKQTVRSADSVRANIAEAYGRFTFTERIRFCHLARGSLIEFESHLRSARNRGLLDESKYQALVAQTGEIGRMLNGFIQYLRSQEANG